MTQREYKLDGQGGESVVEWPATSVSARKTDVDLGPPLHQLLVDLHLQGSPDATDKAEQLLTSVTGTPVGIAIIESGATAASKGWAGVIAVFGGGTTIAALTRFLDRPFGLIAAAVVVAACLLAAGLIMYGDVRARGEAAAELYRARAAITVQFLREAAGPGRPAAPAEVATADRSAGSQLNGAPDPSLVTVVELGPDDPPR